MAFDALSLSLLIKELREKAIGAKLNKIFQPEKDELHFLLFNGGSFRLVLSANASVNRFCVTAFPAENPLAAPSFCMLLRKHVAGGVISGITQQPFERVVELTIENKNELGYKQTKRLIFEVTGKSANIILTDENYTILDTLKHFDADLNSQKLLVAGAKYRFFEKTRLYPDEGEKIAAAAREFNGDLFDFFASTVAGLSPRTIRELCAAAGDQKKNAAAALESYLKKLLSPKPQIIFDKGRPCDVVPFDYESYNGEKIYFETLNAAHDRFYHEKDKALRFAEKSKSISTVIKNALIRTEKKLGLQKQALIEAQDGEKYRIFGDLILSNLHRIKKSDEKLTAQNYYEDACPETEIPLNKALTPQQNAQQYYKKYNKLKKSLLYNRKLVEENSELVDYLKSLSYSVSISEESDLPQIEEEMKRAGLIKVKKNSASKNKDKEILSAPKRYEIEGFSVFVGKNNLQNEQVSFRIAKAKDIWLHTQTIHSGHVAIITEGREVPPSVLLKAAEITAFFSQARSGTKIAVDYTLRANVKKPSGAKTGFVTYTDFSTLIVNPDEHTELLKA